MKKILFYMVVAVTLFGCSSDLLDIQNPNQATLTTFWKTSSDAQSGINACYSSLYKEGTWMRWLSFRYDLTSDEGKSLSPWVELADWCHFNYNNYNFYEGNVIHWQQFYQAIFRCNQVIKYVPDIDMDATLKNQIIGQAEFLRALWYFQINILWEKGALVTEPVDAGYEPADATEEQIWAQVEADLKDAADKLPESWTGTDGGRATKGAAKALLGKALMQQHKYADAQAQLKWLIDKEGTLYGLIDKWTDNFTDLNELNKEGIFEIQFDDTNKGGTGNDASMATGYQRTQFFAPSGIGWGDGMANRWLVDEYLKEKRTDGTNDMRLYNSILYQDVLKDFPNGNPKYYSKEISNWLGNGWGTNCFVRKYNTAYYRDREDYFARNNYRIMRYADILLNYAECIAESNGSLSDAASYVDKVRTRVGLAKLADSQWKDCLNSKEAFMKRLQMERTLELCYEGWRWADLKRWGLLDTQAGIDELKARDPEFNNFVIGKHRRLPIPQTEIDNSGGKLTQNPMY